MSRSATLRLFRGPDGGGRRSREHFQAAQALHFRPASSFRPGFCPPKLFGAPNGPALCPVGQPFWGHGWAFPERLRISRSSGQFQVLALLFSKWNFCCASARHDRCLYCRASPVALPLCSRYSRPRTRPGRPRSARHRAPDTRVTPWLVSQSLARPRSPFVGLCAISRALRPKFPQLGIVAPKAHFRPVPRLDTAAPFENVPFRNP